jgi:hypothetical protein
MRKSTSRNSSAARSTELNRARARTRVTTVVAIVLFAGAVKVGAQTGPQPDVYAVLLQARYHAVLGSTMLVLNRSIPMPTLRGSSTQWLKQFDDVPLALRDAASRPVPTKPKPFDSASFPAGTRMISKADIDARFDEKIPRSWDEFKRRYGAAGWISFSEAILSRDGLDALVYYEAHCGGLCGEGGYAWLHRDSQQTPWSIRLKAVSWIS